MPAAECAAAPARRSLTLVGALESAQAHVKQLQHQRHRERPALETSACRQYVFPCHTRLPVRFVGGPAGVALRRQRCSPVTLRPRLSPSVPLSRTLQGGAILPYKCVSV